MNTKVEKLQKRLNELAEKQPLHAEPRPWFGFHAPVHPYDPANIRFDIFNRNAWEWFCLLQMSATELDEYVAISVWNTVNGYPLTTYGTAPDLQAEAEALHTRRQEIEIVVQARAEELDRKDPEAWIRWKEFYKQLEDQNQSTEATDEPASDELADDSPGKQMRLLWSWTLQVLEAYRRCEKERTENGDVRS